MEPNNDAKEKAKDSAADDGSCTSSNNINETTNDGKGQNTANKRSRTLSEEQIAERKAANRRSAMESRERRKAMIAELNNNVQVLSDENKQLKAIQEAMQYELQTVVLENQQLRMICAQAMQQGLAVVQQPTNAPGNSTLPAPTAIMGQPVSNAATQAPAADTTASAAHVTNQQQPANFCNTSASTSGILTPNAQSTLPNAGTIPLSVANQSLMSLLGAGNMLPFQMMQAMVANGMLPPPQVADTTFTTGPPQVNPTTLQTNPTSTGQVMMNGMPPVAPVATFPAAGAMMTPTGAPPSTTQTAVVQGNEPQADGAGPSVQQANPFHSLQEDQGGGDQCNDP
jgi:hypothetical protein